MQRASIAKQTRVSTCHHKHLHDANHAAVPFHMRILKSRT